MEQPHDTPETLPPARPEGAGEPIPTSPAPPELRRIPLDRIDPDPDQPRRHFDDDRLLELADDLSRHGIDQPLTVRSAGGGRYRLVAGERRFRAAQLADMAEVPVLVRDDLSPEAAAMLQLRENLQREDLSPVEVAQGLERFKGLTGKTWEAVAEEFGWRPNTLHARRQVLKAPEPVLALLREKKLHPSHYREIAALDPGQQIALAERAVMDGMTVGELREERERFKAGETGAVQTQTLKYEGNGDGTDDFPHPSVDVRPGRAEGVEHREEDRPAVEATGATTSESPKERRKWEKAATEELRVSLDAAVYARLEQCAAREGKRITGYARRILTEAADSAENNGRGAGVPTAPTGSKVHRSHSRSLLSHTSKMQKVG